MCMVALSNHMIRFHSESADLLKVVRTIPIHMSELFVFPNSCCSLNQTLLHSWFFCLLLALNFVTHSSTRMHMAYLLFHLLR